MNNPRWAHYARIQSSAKNAASVCQSDAFDIRLDRILDSDSEDASIERSVQSDARKQRHRQMTRSTTPAAFAPDHVPDPEQALIWKQAWMAFHVGIPIMDQLVLVEMETSSSSIPMTGAERTRMSRIRSTAAYRRMRSDIFGSK